MFADMVGYTALMQENEAEARSRRDRFRSVLNDAVQQHHGEILQHYGDGTLSVFESAVEAVVAAVAVQTALRAAEPHVPVRIGVHTGDIVHDADGVYGDGVNVAARIESLSAPGGVLVSGKVYDEIKNHASLSVEPMGEVRLKNVKLPLKVFAIANEGLHVPSPEAVHSKAGTGDGALGQGHPVTAETSEGAQRGAGERLLASIRERSLIQWVVLYIVGAWAALAAASYATAAFAWTPWLFRGLTLVAAVGLPVTLVVAWYHGETGRQRVRGPEVLMIAVLLAIGGGLLTVFGPEGRLKDGVRQPLGPVDGAQAQPSIAVLPFSNLSGTPETEPFANGIHDDILTQLSKIGGLKVISRTSVLGYRDTDKGIPEIARELGVGAVLEAGVQRVNDRIRINAQLIDAGTDAHLWAEQYDTVYTVENVFAIQSAIASSIASALEAVLTRDERARIDDVPTSDLAAYELYLSGLENLTRAGWARVDLERAQEDFEGATAIDPDFALAHAHLAVIHFLFVRVGYDVSAQRVRWILESAERSLALDPDLSQGHQALSQYYYVTQQADRALTELVIAARGLPSDPWIPATQGMIRQRQGAWDQAIIDLERAVELDPRNAELLFLLGDTYGKLRRWEDAERQYDRTLALAPGLPEAQLIKAMLAIDREGDPQPVLDVLASLPPGVDPMGQRVFFTWWGRFLSRDFEGSDDALTAGTESPDAWHGGYPVSVLRGLSLRYAGRSAEAQSLVEASLPSLVDAVEERPDDARVHSGLGLAYALLGSRDDAVGEGLRATELIPISQNAYDGPVPLSDLARIYTLVGELDLAVDQLETILSVPGDFSVGEIRLDPMWDPLRGLPRFQQLVAR
jgi:serine/threonine-protein kinase